MTTPTIDSFVPYEQAVALKELGYDEAGYFFFSTSFCTDGSPVVVHKGFAIPYSNNEISEISDEYTSAPTTSQVTRWLRNKHSLSVQVSYNVGKADWYCCVVDMKTGYNLYSKFGNKTYEQANLNGISEAIEIINNNLHI